MIEEFGLILLVLLILFGYLLYYATAYLLFLMSCLGIIPHYDLFGCNIWNWMWSSNTFKAGDQIVGEDQVADRDQITVN